MTTIEELNELKYDTLTTLWWAKCIVLCIALAFVLLCINDVSATISTDITLGANDTTALINLDTAEYGFDVQTISYGDFEVVGFTISEFLKGIDFEASFEDNKPTFTYVNISTPYSKMMIDNVLSYFNYTFTSDDINNNLSLMENFTDYYSSFGITIENGTIKKTGTQYNIHYEERMDNLSFNYTLDFGNSTLEMSGNLLGVTLKSGNETIVASITLLDTTIPVTPAPSSSRRSRGGRTTKLIQIVPQNASVEEYEPLEEENEPLQEIIELNPKKEEKQESPISKILRVVVWGSVVGAVVYFGRKGIKLRKEKKEKKK